MLQGWLKQGVPAADVHVVEPVETLRARAQKLGVTVYAAADDLAGELLPTVVVIAVKPQAIANVLPPYRRFAKGGATVLSIAAGTLISTIETILGPGTAVLRCMPNTPAAIGKGMLVCCTNRYVDRERLAFCEELLSSSGRVAFVDDEALMDAVTGVSGSGPAYVFHFIESLTAAAISVGLPESLAKELALQTVYGSAAMAAHSDESAAELRVKVTSPNGTTAAALNVLMGDDRLKRLMTDAVIAATNRSRELGRSSG